MAKRLVGCLILCGVIIAPLYIHFYSDAGANEVDLETPQKELSVVTTNGEHSEIPVSQQQSIVGNNSVDPDLSSYAEGPSVNLNADSVQQAARALALISRQQGNLSDNLISAINSGEISANESLRSESEVYTPFYTALLLDKDMNSARFQKFIEVGGIVYNSPIWVEALSHTSPEVMKLLIDYGLNPANNRDGLPMAFHALVKGNFEGLQFLEESGFVLDTNYRLKTDGNEDLGEINVRAFIESMPDSERKTAQIEYLKKYFDLNVEPK